MPRLTPHPGTPRHSPPDFPHSHQSPTELLLSSSNNNLHHPITDLRAYQPLQTFLSVLLLLCLQLTRTKCNRCTWDTSRPPSPQLRVTLMHPAPNQPRMSPHPLTIKFQAQPMTSHPRQRVSTNPRKKRPSPQSDWFTMMTRLVQRRRWRSYLDMHTFPTKARKPPSASSPATQSWELFKIPTQ